MNIDFKGQTILITGATRGIGKQIAEDMQKAGATNLILTGTNEIEIEKLNRKNALESIRYLAVDFLNEKSTEEFLKTMQRLGKIDVCVNNAGINRINEISKTVVSDWCDVIAVNLNAPFLITKTVSSIMKKNKYGRIINISSIWGVISKEKRSAYSTSKFGIRGLTVTSAIELAPYNILVNSVSPGFILTELTKSILSVQERKQLAKQVPMRRFGTPQEVSKVVLFLASKENTYMTGQNLIVDGGFVNV